MITNLNTRVLLSLAAIGVAGALIIGATLAFFSDTETSKDNLLQAGAIDLGIDNHSYLNGEINPGTTWRIDYDLDEAEGTRQFFDFDDLKPGDWGEDTISLHVKNNDSWLCADVRLTSDDDNDCTEPENDEEGANCPLDGSEPDGDNTDGDLADAVNFYWWADDGDNVFEEGERLLPAGPMGNLDVGETATVALADSQTNIWSPGPNPSPFPGDEVRFIAKAWCFGDTTMTPYAQDGFAGVPDDPNTPENESNHPDTRPVLCDGSQVNNVAQTDSFTADISFRAIQSRNNEEFVCGIPQPQ